MDEYYLILESALTDDLETIHKNYIRLIKKYHPDKNFSLYNIEKTKEINNAYEKIKENFEMKKKNIASVPKGFRDRGFNYIPTLHEFVFNEIWGKKEKLTDNSYFLKGWF